LKVADRLRRTPPYPFTELARLKREALEKGVNIIDMGIGDPDLPTPPHIVEAMQKAAADPSTHQYDETPMGLPEFLEAAALRYRERFGVALDPKKQILRTIGSKEAIAHLAWAVLDPGDVALLPDPAYPVYATSAAFAGADVYRMPLLPEKGYLPDLDAIPTEAANRAKLMWLCYPNMPTAGVAGLAFFQRVVEFARRHEILVALDMAYADITFDGYACPTILQVPGAIDLAVEMHSLSKSYNMTGWRIGYAVGNEEALAALQKIKSNIDSGAFMAIQKAAAAALNGPQECVEKMRQIYGRRRDLLVDGLRSLGWKLEKPKATIYVWAPVPDGSASGDFCEKLLSRCAILATPGRAYGEHGEGFIRFSLTVQACPPKLQRRRGAEPERKIQEAISRIREWQRTS
jgi:LL-diaminopimelate aminotransferase